jgi:sugar O-acyltransferase (sialic acid O-acetyltransferase NeuD family)
MKPLLVVGSSGHAGGVLEAVELRAEYRVIGLLDDCEMKGALKHGRPVLGSIEEASEVAANYACRNVFVAIGDNWSRWNVASKLRAAIPGIEFPVIVHPSTPVSAWARIGAGTIVMAGSVIAVNARVGEGCIVYTGSTVNHDCRMGDYSSVSGGVHMGGASAIGFRSSLGLGVLIREKTRVGDDCVVGAGSLVLNDVPDGMLIYGAPAKVIRPRAADESYMR